MTLSQVQIDELRGLLGRLANGPMTHRETERLNELLAADTQAQQIFADYAMLEACLEMVWTSGEGQTTCASEPAESEFVDGALPVIIEASPALHAPLSTLYPVGSFLFSYMAAVVIVGMGLLIGWAYQVSIPRSDYREVVEVAPRPMPTDLRSEPEMVFGGRVTDMIDCQWADPKTGTICYAYVPLGRKYALASGLMEITYDTGAKVILQGPCTYQVESRTGGYLTLGRLTAKVEKRRDGKADRDRNPANQQSTIDNQQSSASLFVVCTPTAKVTDLGTEFGVEVDKFGASVAQVYEGKVELLAAGGAAEDAKAICLGENESARVAVGKDRVARVVRGAGQPSPFVRQMPRRVRIKMFNTGVNLKEGDSDPHWQLVARTDDPKCKPWPAMVTETRDTRRLSNQSDRSQWISAVGDSVMPDAVTYTFRTTFDLKGMRPSTAVLHGRFVVDNHVRAIRLNGRSVPVPAHGHREFGFFHAFSSDRGFVEGINVLEIDVENGDPQAIAPSSLLGLLVELEGSVFPAWPEPSANMRNAKQKQSKN